MRVLIVGDGPHEEAALPILVRQINARIGATEFDRFKNIPRPVHGRGNRILKRALGWFFQAAKRGFDGIVLLIDEDGDHDRRRAIDEAQESIATQFPRACGIAIRSFDAWFLADQVALSAVLERTIQRQPDPERHAHPKQACQRLIQESDTSSLSELYRRLAECMDLDTVCERCPDGFTPFAERIARLSQATQSAGQIIT